MGIRIKQSYHWVIVVLVSLEMAVFGGLINSLNVFLIPICQDLSLTRGAYAATDVPYHIASALSTMVSMVLYRKTGYKKASVMGLVFAAGSLCLLAVSRSLALIGFCRVLLGIGYGLALTTGSVWVINNWFIQYRGLIIGLVSMFTGLGGSLMTVICTALTELWGWRIANLILAGVILLTVFLYLLLLRDRPEHIGLQPFGRENPQKQKKPAQLPWEGLPLRQWQKKPLFYLVLLFAAVFAVAIYTVYFVVVPHFRDLGFSPQSAAMYQSVCMLALAVSKLLCGALTDKVGAKAVAAGCIFCGVVGQGLLSLTADPVLCYLGVIALAIGLGTTTVMIPLLTPSLFGYYASDSITSLLLAIISLSSIPAKLIANVSFDAYGSYFPSFRLSAVANAVMLFVFIGVLILSGKERRS